MISPVNGVILTSVFSQFSFSGKYTNCCSSNPRPHAVLPINGTPFESLYIRHLLYELFSVTNLGNNLFYLLAQSESEIKLLSSLVLQEEDSELVELLLYSLFSALLSISAADITDGGVVPCTRSVTLISNKHKDSCVWSGSCLTSILRFPPDTHESKILFLLYSFFCVTTIGWQST